MLPDNQIGTGQRRLFGGDIDIKVGVKLIEGAYLYAVKRPPAQASAYSHASAADKDAHKLSESLISLR
jgi:hypothetical protein